MVGFATGGLMVSTVQLTRAPQQKGLRSEIAFILAISRDFASYLRNKTMRFVFVPLKLLSTPQQFAVLVNFWSFINTSTGSKPAATPQGRTVSSSFVLPP